MLRLLCLLSVLLVLLLVTVVTNGLTQEAPQTLPSARILDRDTWGRGIAISPDGRLLASGSGDGAVKLWDVYTKKLLATLEGLNHSSVISVAFSLDGRLLASGSDDTTVDLWDVDTKKLLATLKGHTAPVGHLAFSSDLLASGAKINDKNDHAVHLWNIAKKEKVHSILEYDNEQFAFLPGTNIFAVPAFPRRVIILWDTNTGASIGTIDAYSHVLAISPDGKILACWKKGKEGIELWGTRGESVITLVAIPKDPNRPSWIRGRMTFSPNGKMLAVATLDLPILRIWDVNKIEVLVELSGDANSIVETRDMVFSLDGKQLITRNEDGITFWDVSSLTGKPGEPGRAVTPQDKLATTWGKIKSN